MDKALQWGIIGAGSIARRLAKGIAESTTSELLAIGSRSQEKADAFGDEFAIPRRYGSYEDLLADDDVQVVYIATPHPMHAEWAIKAAEAGKHLLVEKPIALNRFEAMAVIDAAREHDVFLMEAFMYRCHPQIARLVEIIRDGKIGEVRQIEATFSFHAEENPESRLFADALGGGGILDVGCYAASGARLVAGAANGKAFEEPIEIKGCGTLGDTGVDYWAVASLKFPGGIVAQLSSGVQLQQENQLKVCGSEGEVCLPQPWVPGGNTHILLARHNEELDEIPVEADKDLYTYEVDTVAANIENRQSPTMSWDDTLGNMKLLDAWRKDVGLVYEAEKPEKYVHTITGRPLKHRKNVMKYGKIEGLDKPVSRMVMGADSNNTMADTAILFDDYFERGGNTFDTSSDYGDPNGAPERNLGQWIRNRGIRDQVVVNEKGGNSPNDTPEGLTYELNNGLERLQLDYSDIYMLHRDNEQVPVGEWVEVLNEHLRAGRMKIFGLSNFTIARLKAFDEYAKKHNLASFSVVSNQFSLAHVLAPIWDCFLVSSSDAESRQWFIDTQTPMMPWSSQARGFFTNRASREDRSNPELVRCWYNEENFKRKERANELAKKKGVEPINIALAYVLNQPFPTFPLFGAKRISETISSLKALEIELTPEEMAWLNLERD